MAHVDLYAASLKPKDTAEAMARKNVVEKRKKGGIGEVISDFSMGLTPMPGKVGKPLNVPDGVIDAERWRKVQDKCKERILSKISAGLWRSGGR
jgi:hypothetical protein